MGLSSNVWMIYSLPSKTEQSSQFNTILTPDFLAEGGYKVSRKKAQISHPTITSQGFGLSSGQRNLLLDRREALA